MPASQKEAIQAHVLKNYKVLAKIGSGAYGHVWKVRDKRTQEVFALKKIFDAFQHSTDAKRTYREIVILRQLQCQQVAKLFKVIRAQNNRDLYLLFELMDCDLHLAILESNLQPSHCSYIAYQLFKSLLYLHSCELLHRDLKPSNILINTKCKIKLCDFGLVRSLAVQHSQQPVLTNEVATRWYRAPEVLLGSKSYSYPADMWSVGCILYEMMAQKPLFPGLNEINQLQKILSVLGFPTEEEMESLKVPDLDLILSKIPKDKVKPNQKWKIPLTEEEVDFILKLLAYDPARRLTPLEAMRHPFVAQFYSAKDEQVQPSKVFLPVNQNVKLTVKQYRNLIYDEISYFYKGSSSVPKLQKSIRLSQHLNRSIQRLKSRSQLKVEQAEQRKKNSSSLVGILPKNSIAQFVRRPSKVLLKKQAYRIRQSFLQNCEAL